VVISAGSVSALACWILQELDQWHSKNLGKDIALTCNHDINGFTRSTREELKSSDKSDQFGHHGVNDMLLFDCFFEMRMPSIISHERSKERSQN